MALSLNKIEKAYQLLKEYKGDNSFIIRTKNTVLAYKTRAMNDFEAEYILDNYNYEPKELNRTVKVAEWWGEKMQQEWGTEFVPQKIKVTWLLGEGSNYWHFYCIYRKSQTKAIEVFASKKGILTDLHLNDWHNLDIDFTPYNEKSGKTLFPYQEEAVKFMVSQKKCILASSMGLGKTFSAIVAALEGKYQHVLIVCPASLKANWKSELMALVPEEDITIVEGSTWRENKFTIINYDILKNFYEVPTETAKRKSLEMGDDGKISLVTSEREVVSRKKKVIAEAMGNSQLYQSHFDLFIIDEAHRLSNTSSGIYKIMSDLVQRSNPKGIFELTGTPITNRPINFYNLLKLINAPIAKDWKEYVERYCDGKHFYKKKERDAHTAIFCRSKGKQSWYDLTYEEKQELDKVLERRCKAVWITNGSSHLDELQEVVKPYYLRRVKEELGGLVKKTIKVLNYQLSRQEKDEYDQVWEEYTNAQQANGKSYTDVEKYKKITEGIMLRQWLAKTMVSKTISLVQKCVDKGHKVVVFCSFDEELYAIQEVFKDICVIHNGKLSAQKKNNAVTEFQNNPQIKVFIGNIQSAGVGLTLTAGDVAVFNSFSWVSGDNQQAQDRIHRLNQTKDVTIYYQVFQNTFYQEMLEKVNGKQNVIDNIIVSEREK